MDSRHSSAPPRRRLLCRVGIHDVRIFPPPHVQAHALKAGLDPWCDWYAGIGPITRKCIHCGA